MPIILVFRRLRQEDYKFKASLDCPVRTCLKKKQKKPKTKIRNLLFFTK
jgi:hypothetical protein